MAERLGEDPRLDERAARNHHGLHAREGPAALDVLRKEDVAVADDRDADGLRDLADGDPIGRVPVACTAGPAMDGEGVGPTCFGRACNIHGVSLVFIPAEPNLDGHRQGARTLLHGRDEPFDASGLPEQGRAQSPTREFVDGAAEVEIDEVRASRRDKGRTPPELVGRASGELHAEAALVGRALDEGELGASPPLEAADDRHLAHRDRGSKGLAEASIGEVASLGHGRHHERGTGQH